jgi:ribulose-5-phosphate 4-epimerase/fuculose-1-phosphate aldolase
LNFHIMENEIKDRLVSAYRVMLFLGLFDYAGDASVRVPGTNTFYIRGARVTLTPTRTTSMVDTTLDDLVKIDFEGNQLEGDLIAPIEMPLHYAIYLSRPDVGGIVHAHARMVTAFSIVRRTIDPVYIRGIECTKSEIPLFDSSESIRTSKLAYKMAQTIGDKRACILRSHGLVTVGATLESACLAAINLEDAALMQWIASTLGEPTVIPERTIKLLGIILLSFRKYGNITRN